MSAPRLTGNCVCSSHGERKVDCMDDTDASCRAGINVLGYLCFYNFMD